MRPAGRLRMLACHGMKPRYYHGEVGVNSRLDTLQAAVLNIKLVKLHTESDARQRQALPGLPASGRTAGLAQVTCPQEVRGMHARLESIHGSCAWRTPR